MPFSLETTEGAINCVRASSYADYLAVIVSYDEWLALAKRYPDFAATQRVRGVKIVLPGTIVSSM